MATPLGYFISDQLYAPLNSLSNTQTIPLHVVTLPVLEEEGETLPGGSYNQRSDNTTISSPHLRKRDCCGVVGPRRRPLAGELSETFGEDESLESVVDSSREKGEERVTAAVEDIKEEVVTQEEEREEDRTELPLKKKRRLEFVSSPAPPLPNHQTHTSSSHSSLMSRAVSVVCAVLEKGCSSWVLDVDLDFFSTANPFRKEFSQVHNNLCVRKWVWSQIILTQEEYTFLERIYKFREPSSNTQKVGGIFYVLIYSPCRGH